MVGVQGVEGGLTVSLLPAGLVWHLGFAAPFRVSYQAPPLPSHPLPAIYVSAGDALGILKKWSLECGVSGTKLGERKQHLLPPFCEGPEHQGEASDTWVPSWLCHLQPCDLELPTFCEPPL